MEKIVKRGRPLGSKNKPKNPKTTLHTVNLEKQVENSPITRENLLYNIINWGKDNDYPIKLLNLYNSSPTHRACVDFSVKSIIGEGIDIDALEGTDIAKPNPEDSWDCILRNLALDFIIYGSFAVEIIKSRNGQSFSYYHVPFEKVRYGKYVDGKINEYYICSDWTDPIKNTPERVDAFVSAEDTKVGRKYLYVYNSYSPANEYYPSPTYVASVTAILAEIEYQNYDYRHITNSFSPSGLLTLPPVETEDEKQEIIRNIQDMFGGGANVNSVMIQFSNGADNSNVAFTPFSSDNTADDYEGANNRVINRILASHSIPSRALIGMPLENAGFASEAAILKNANELYQTLVGKSNRKIIVDSLNDMLAMNNIDANIKVKELQFDFDNETTNEE